MPELIDRAKLLEYLAAIKPDEYVSAYGEAAVDVINHVETYVSEMPTIEAELVNLWIPCSERLPENRCGVIFTVDRGHPFVCVGYRINTEREGLKLQRWFDKLSGLNFSDYDVKAWMPMPDAYEPPKE